MMENSLFAGYHYLMAKKHLDSEKLKGQQDFIYCQYHFNFHSMNQGYNDVRVFGPWIISTPNLDHAKDGAKLMNFLCAQAVCSAHELLFLTGSYSQFA